MPILTNVTTATLIVTLLVGRAAGAQQSVAPLPTARSTSSPSIASGGSVVLVRVVNTAGDTIFGNGVIATAPDLVVTERSVLDDAKAVAVLLAGSTTPVAATVVGIDDASGGAVLRAPGLRGYPTPLARRSIAAGDVVVLSTALPDVPATSQTTSVRRMRPFAGANLAELAARLDAESNGAAVTDPSGALVAIAFFSDEGGVGHTYGIPVRYVERFLASDRSDADPKPVPMESFDAPDMSEVLKLYVDAVDDGFARFRGYDHGRDKWQSILRLPGAEFCTVGWDDANAPAYLYCNMGEGLDDEAALRVVDTLRTHIRRVAPAWREIVKEGGNDLHLFMAPASGSGERQSIIVKIIPSGTAHRYMVAFSIDSNKRPGQLGSQGAGARSVTPVLPVRPDRSRLDEILRSLSAQLEQESSCGTVGAIRLSHVSSILTTACANGVRAEYEMELDAIGSIQYVFDQANNGWYVRFGCRLGGPCTDVRYSRGNRVEVAPSSESGLRSLLISNARANATGGGKELVAALKRLLAIP